VFLIYLLHLLLELTNKQNLIYCNNENKIFKISEFKNDTLKDYDIYVSFDDQEKVEIYNDSLKLFKDNWLTNYYNNVKYYNQVINKNGIHIDNPFLVSNEISDFYKILSSIDNENEIKHYKPGKYVFEHLNLNIRFNPSNIERFIPNNSKIISFQFTISDNLKLSNEIIKLNNSILEIKFLYEKERIKKIIYKMIYDDGEVFHSVTIFNYKS
jgi:hypothetical protein